MKFDLDKVVRDRMIIDQLEVQSFDMNIYLVKLTVGTKSGMLYQNSSIKRFHNAEQIRQAFQSIHVGKATLVLNSAYDEMIGNPPKATETWALPFSMTNVD